MASISGISFLPAVAAGTLLLSVDPSTACAQKVSLGVIAGTNLTNDFRSGQETYSGLTSEVHRGSGIELHLPWNWSVDADALYRPLKSTSTTLINPGLPLPGGRVLNQLGPSTETHTSWEFPVLAKYRLPLAGHRTFVALGPSFRPAGSGAGLSHVGLTAGLGVDLPIRGLNVSPSVRYTRWSSANRSSLGGAIQDQIEVFVGFSGAPASASVSAFGKRIAIGGIFGVLGNDFQGPAVFTYSRVPESNNPIPGMMVEVTLPRSLSIEVNGLYRALHG